MLTIEVLGQEHWDEELNEFVYPESFELTLEHSLVSLSKWEEEHEKPFMGKEQKSTEETLSYVYHMILTHGKSRQCVRLMTDENIQQVQEYIDKAATATWFAESMPEPKSNEVITTELIYYWMNTMNIPLEAQHWNFNRLLTLIKIHTTKNSQPKKMGKNEMMQRRREINERNKAKFNTRG